MRGTEGYFYYCPMVSPQSESQLPVVPFSRRIIMITSVAIAVCAAVGLLLGYYTSHMMDELMAGRIHEFPKGYALFNALAFIMRPLTYDMSRTYWTRIVGERLNFLDHLPALLVAIQVIGVIFFILTKQAGMRLLRFTYSTWFIFRLFALFSYLIYQIMLPVKLEYYELKRDVWYVFVLVIVTDLIWMALCAWMLFALKKCTKVKLVYEEGVEVFVPASRWLRFVHMQIDGWLIILILLSFTSTFLWMIREKIGSGQDVSILKFMFYLTIFIIQFVYYTVLEGAWCTTPAKGLTGTTVIDDKGNGASLRAVVNRTLSRFIPFDNFSFFARRGWHDRFGDTWVCREEEITPES